MAVVVLTSPVQGSLKIDTYGNTPFSSASPVSRYWNNMQTVRVMGYTEFANSTPTFCVELANSNSQPMETFQLANIAQIGASPSTAFPTVQQAVNLISGLIYH